MSNNLKFIGGLSNTTLWLDNGKHLSRNYRQGNRIYDSCGIATGLTSQGVGSYGGHVQGGGQICPTLMAGGCGIYRIEEIKDEQE